jgi:two-component system, OmpR family, phosphate regulon response regulator PhoB
MRQPRRPPRMGNSGARRSILIVEDDADLRRLYRMTLTFAGFNVREAGDGVEALRAIESERPDLVVLDLMLPALSGRAVRDELTAQAHTRDIPVVVVTGASGVEVEQVNADCVLAKPISSDQLVETVRRCLVSRRANPRE